MDYCIINVRDLEMMKKSLEKHLAIEYLNNGHYEVEYTMKLYKMIYMLVCELINEPTEKVMEVVVDFFRKNLWREFEGKDFKEIYNEINDVYLSEAIYKISKINTDDKDNLKIVDVVNSISEILALDE